MTVYAWHYDPNFRAPLAVEAEQPGYSMGDILRRVGFDVDVDDGKLVLGPKTQLFLELQAN